MLCLVYGYNLENHGSTLLYVSVVATKVSIYDLDSDQLIIEFGSNRFDQLIAWKLKENQALYLELNDEIEGPTELYYDYYACGNIADSDGNMPVFSSKKYPQVKISRPNCNCMIWAKAIETDSLDALYDLDCDFDIYKALNTCCNMKKYTEQVKYVCRKLGIRDATQEGTIGWEGGCCS